MKKTMIRASIMMLAMLTGLRGDVDAGANPNAYTRSPYTLMLATRFWSESKGSHEGSGKRPGAEYSGRNICKTFWRIC